MGQALGARAWESVFMAALGVFVGRHLPHSLHIVLEPMTDSRTTWIIEDRSEKFLKVTKKYGDPWKRSQVSINA